MSHVNSPELKPLIIFMVFYVWKNDRGLSQAMFRTEDDRRPQRTAAGDSLTHGTADRQSCKSFRSDWRTVL